MGGKDQGRFIFAGDPPRSGIGFDCVFLFSPASLQQALDNKHIFAALPTRESVVCFFFM